MTKIAKLKAWMIAHQLGLTEAAIYTGCAVVTALGVAYAINDAKETNRQLEEARARGDLVFQTPDSIWILSMPKEATSQTA